MFEDLMEQSYAFERLEEYAIYPDNYDLSDETGANSYLNKLLNRLILKVEKLEQETINKNPKYQLGFSYQSQLLQNLLFLFGASNTPIKLLANISEIKILLLQAMFIGLEVKNGILYSAAEIGEAVINGGKKGHTKVYGDDFKKNENRKQWQLWVDELLEKHPNFSFEKIKRLVVENHGHEVSIHQLKRYTKDNRKKS